MPHDIFTTIETAIKAATGASDALLTDGGEHADLASTVAFALAKEKKQAPLKIAQNLVAELQKRPDLSGITIEAKGPYINFIFGKAYPCTLR